MQRQQLTLFFIVGASSLVACSSPPEQQESEDDESSTDSTNEPMGAVQTGGTAGTGGSGATGGSAATGGTGGSVVEPPPRRSLLLMTKTAGYRHDSIPAGITAVEQMSAQEGWTVLATEDSASFNAENLLNFDAVIFLSTTGDILSDAEQVAFQSFIESGGGFVGVHAATDTEPDWPWYRQLVGAHFESHPEIQGASITVEVDDHPATAHLSSPWLRADEWYNFDVNPRDQSTVLLSLDEATYIGGNMGDHPISWVREFTPTSDPAFSAPARLFYTALGHTTASYSEPEFVDHLRGGLSWVLE